MDEWFYSLSLIKEQIDKIKIESIKKVKYFNQQRADFN